MNKWIHWVFNRAILLIVVLTVSVLEPLSARADQIHLPIEIMIDAGHGGIDGGTSYGDTLEKTINLEVALKLYKLLNEDGYQVILNRTGDYALSDENEWLRHPSRHIRDLAQRKQLAAEVDPQLLISLHVNWSSNPTQSGPVVLYQKSGLSYLLATVIQQRLNHLYGSKESPRKGKTFYLLNKTSMPTVIVEMGFLSNPHDRAKLTTPKGQEQLARAIGEAVKDYVILTGYFP
ncbi:MAG: N-acetylmuramoyl-L-alanine amidase family protein [Clostridia bacterium]